MRKFLVGALLLFVFAITLPVLSYAQSCNIRRSRGRSANYSYANYGYDGYNNRRNYNRGNYRRNNERGYYQPAYYRSAPRRTYYRPASINNYYGSNRPSFYRRHRNAINIGLGTGGGALLGGLLGGRRGAVIGALAGAGGSALYTYKIRPKQQRYYR